MIDHLLIEEIITKECERYELEKNGFVADREAAVKEMLSGEFMSLSENCSLAEFADWKGRLLNDWYVRKGFARFFRRKADKRCMFRLVKRLLLNAVSRFRRKQTEATVDDELRMEEGRTVAFKLSSALFAKLYPEMCCNGTLFISPGQLEEACVGKVRSLFPLAYPSLYERLLTKDNEFWGEVWRLVYRFVRFLVTENRGREDEETVKEVSMETILSIQEQLERGKLKQVVSATHLLNSLQMTGRNKYREWLRAEEKRRVETLLEEEDWQSVECQTMAVAKTDGMDGRFAYLLEVNEKSEYDVCCALSDVLNYGRGEIYEELVRGMQETVRVILMLYVENKRYEEIARILYGTSGGRKQESLRKSVSRGKEYLKKRMISLIIEYKHKGYVPFIEEEEE